MAFQTGPKASPAVHGQLKLAHLLKMPERTLAEQVRELEADPIFARLRDAQVLSVDPYPAARFVARRHAGRELGPAAVGLGDLLDGQGRLARLIKRIGQLRFEECFLGDASHSDGTRAQICRISVAEARELREFMDRVYIQTEIEGTSLTAAPHVVFSAVAGIEISKGVPIIAFFHREIWKGRYDIDQDRLGRLNDSLPPGEREGLRRFLRRLEFVDLRKTTLYRALETILKMQADYLKSGDRMRRRAFTQRDLADQIYSSPVVIHLLISNKSVRLPWGLEAPMKSLLPSSKSLQLENLAELATRQPDLSDEGLRREMERSFGARLSRRSIAQYRKERGLGGRGLRTAKKPNR